MSKEFTFDQGYLFGLLAIDNWIRGTMKPNDTVKRIRAEIIELMNDVHFGTYTEEVDHARNNRCE